MVSFVIVPEDCTDASMSIWALGSCADSSAVQMQCKFDLMVLMIPIFSFPFFFYLLLFCVNPILRNFELLYCFSCQVIRADYLSGRTSLHFAAVNGHVRCIRLAVADFVPSSPFEALNVQNNGSSGDGNTLKNKNDHRFGLLLCALVF